MGEEQKKEMTYKMWQVFSRIVWIILLFTDWFKFVVPEWVWQFLGWEGASFSIFDISRAADTIANMGAGLGIEIAPGLHLIAPVVNIIVWGFTILNIAYIVSLFAEGDWGVKIGGLTEKMIGWIWVITWVFVWIMNLTVSKKTDGEITKVIGLTSTFYLYMILDIAYFVITILATKKDLKEFITVLINEVRERNK